MSLDFVLLGTLRAPTSGYGVKARFDEVFHHFWPAEQSQIYRTLRRLERSGLLSSRAEASDKGPEQRVYRTTAKGRAALRRWLQEGPRVRDDRHAFCAQVFFLDELDDIEGSLAFFRSLRGQYAERLTELETTEREWRKADPSYPDVASPEDLTQQFALALGLEKYAAIVRWTDACIQRLEARRSGTAASRKEHSA